MDLGQGAGGEWDEGYGTKEKNKGPRDGGFA